ncbi:alginate lyase family protein [Enterovibrio sp. FF113]|uniref:alginate lyase family protein n=1 Tax=Enterovibrio sp. FF113 TaxID=3230010 RepID=UPI00352EA77D
MKITNYFISAIACLFILQGCASTKSEEITAPPQYTMTVSLKIAERNCQAIPPYKNALVFNSKYNPKEKSKSTVVAGLEKQYEASTAYINQFAFRIVKLSDSLIKNPRSGDLNCYLSLLSDWAQHSSLANSESINHVGKAVRKWTLAAISSSYLKVSLSHQSAIPPVTDQQIKAWISVLAYQVKQDYSNRKPTQINNHDYWAGWSVMASAAVLNDRVLYQWAEDVFVYAAKQIDQQGLLPNELKREKRAAAYHNYAMQPLAMLGLFVSENNPQLFNQHRDSIERLTSNLFRHALGDSVFEIKSGFVQVEDEITIKGRSAWLAPYLTYSPSQESDIKAVMALSSNFRSTRLGGDLGYLFITSNSNHK